MGRGRAKAKQTKVARALKYSTTATDLERLQRELANAGDADGGAGFAEEEDEEVDDEGLAR